MAFAYPTVTIGSTTYTVLDSIADVDAWLSASFAATKWQAIPPTDTTTKPRAMVSATRWFDMVKWLGVVADPTQDHAWPRDNLTYNGVPVDPTSIPPPVENGFAELCNALFEDPTLQQTLNQPLPKEIHAGPAGMQFFRPQNVQILSPLPTLIMGWVGAFISGVGDVDSIGVVSSGTDEQSLLDRPFDYQHGI